MVLFFNHFLWLAFGISETFLILTNWAVLNCLDIGQYQDYRQFSLKLCAPWKSIQRKWLKNETIDQLTLDFGCLFLSFPRSFDFISVFRLFKRNVKWRSKTLNILHNFKDTILGSPSWIFQDRSTPKLKVNDL